MRRFVVVGIVGVALAVALISEALAAPNASVDDRIKEDEAIFVNVTNCDSGNNFTAYFDVTVTRSDGFVYSDSSHFTDNDPATPEGLNIWMREAGTYSVRVRCRHVFNNGNEGIWYDETEETVVTGITAEERKKCKNKPTRKARRRCLRRAALN